MPAVKAAPTAIARDFRLRCLLIDNVSMHGFGLVARALRRDAMSGTLSSAAAAPPVVVAPKVPDPINRETFPARRLIHQDSMETLTSGGPKSTFSPAYERLDRIFDLRRAALG